jgi:hypothetical protein
VIKIIFKFHVDKTFVIDVCKKENNIILKRQKFNKLSKQPNTLPNKRQQNHKLILPFLGVYTTKTTTTISMEIMNIALTASTFLFSGSFC